MDPREWLFSDESDDRMETSVPPQADIIITPDTPNAAQAASNPDESTESSPASSPPTAPQGLSLAEISAMPSPPNDGMELDYIHEAVNAPAGAVAATAAHKTGLTPENTLLAIESVESGLLTTPQNVNLPAEESPLTPSALLDYTLPFVPNVILPKRSFFTLEDIAEFKYDDAKDLVRSVAAVTISWVEYGQYKFRRASDDALWEQAFHRATQAYPLTAAFADLKWLLENTQDADGNRRDPRTWADQASRISLYIAQFTLGYDADTYRSGSNPTEIQNGMFFDETLLRVAGLTYANIQELHQAAIGYLNAKGDRTYPSDWHTKFRNAGGITLNQARRSMMYRFPQLVRQLGEPEGIVKSKEVRVHHMDNAAHWKPVKDAFERVMTGALAYGYLTEGSLAEDYNSWALRWLELSTADKAAFTAAIRQESGLAITLDENPNFWDHSHVVRQGWLWPFSAAIFERCNRKLRKAIEVNAMKEIHDWAEYDLSYFIVPSPATNAKPTVKLWYRKTNAAMTGTILRSDDDEIDLLAATFSRDLYNLEHAAFQATTVLPRFFDLKGNEVGVGQNAREETQQLVESLHKELNTKFFKPALKAVENVKPDTLAPIYLPEDQRDDSLTTYRAGTENMGSIKSGSTHYLTTGVVLLERHPPGDPVEDVEVEMHPPQSSQNDDFFNKIEETKVEFSPVLAALHASFKKDVQKLATPAVQAKIKTILDLFQENNHLWSHSARNVTGNAGSDYGGTAAVLDARTLIRRLLSGAADDGIFKRDWIEEVGQVYDRLLAISTVLPHPGLWMLSIENVIGALPNAPTNRDASLLLSEIFLILRHGLFTAIVQSEANRTGDARKSQGEDAYYSVICRSIGFVVSAQRGLCSRGECRRSLFVDRSTAPCNTIKNDRQLTTSSLFTRMGMRTLVIKGNMGVPPAVLRSSRGPCPWLYLPMRLPKAVLAALVRMAKFEHRFDKYQRDRTFSGMAVWAHLASDIGEGDE